MNKTTLAILTALTASTASLPLFANPAYRYENTIQYSQANSDAPYINDADYRQFLLAGVTYFDTVKATRGPLAESAFLERASGFHLAFSRADIEYTYGASDVGIEIEQQQYTGLANVDYYVPDSIFFVSVGARGSKYEVEYRSLSDAPSAIKDEGDWEYSWTGGLGIAPADGLLIWSNFYEDQDFGGYWNLNGKYVWLLQNEQAINVQLSYAQNDGDDFDSSREAISADYYFDKTISLGAVYSVADDGVTDADAYELRGRKFFGDMTSVNISYIHREDEDLGALGCSFRF